MIQALLALLLVALIVAALKWKSAPAKLAPVVVVLVILIFALQSMLIVRGCRTASWAVGAEDFFQAGGYMLGQAIVPHAPEGGPILVIHGGGDFKSARQVRASYFDGLRAGLDSSAFRLVEGDLSQVDNGDMLGLEQSLTLDMFPQFLQQCPDAVAIISMVGVPGIPKETRRPPADLPPLFILGTPRSSRATPLFRAGVLKAAVFFKGSFDPDAKPTRGMSMEELFGHRFVLVESGG